MNPEDLADATARALDQLPPGDPARADPRFLRDVILAREALMTRETAADVWLAVSPLRVAPPGVLHEIMETIRPPGSHEFFGRKFLPWLAASGWAAAAMLALLLWPRAAKPPTAAENSVNPRTSGTSMTPDFPPVETASSDRPRREIARLQRRLAELHEARRSDLPRVMSLNAPGGERPSDREARQRIQTILTEALRSALEAESGAPTDPAALVIERGWPAGGVTVPAEGAIIRHRNFPEHAWQALGLQRSDSGDYYDSSRQMLWTADPEGRGFLGRKIASEEELIGFNTGLNPANEPDSPRTTPEGFVIENPLLGSAEVVIDQVPPPAEGSAQYFVWTDSAGRGGSLPLTSIGGIQNFSSTSTQTVITTIPNSGSLTSFQLVERPLVPNGQPDQIIVQGAP